MTTRERKYHRRKRDISGKNGILPKIMALGNVVSYPTAKKLEGIFNDLLSGKAAAASSRPFKYWDKKKEGVIDSPVAGEPIIITLTKYNLPRNQSLHNGQLN